MSLVLSCFYPSCLMKTRLQVNYFNEVHAVWEPLIERVDGGQRRWNLELEVNLHCFVTYLFSFVSFIETK